MKFITPHPLDWQLFKILTEHGEYNYLGTAQQQDSHTLEYFGRQLGVYVPYDQVILGIYLRKFLCIRIHEPECIVDNS